MDPTTRTVHLPGLGGGLDFEVLADDAIIGPAIERGAWAEDEVALMRAHIGPGSRVVDLGANVGWFAVQAVLAGAEVHAFEPVPAIAALARRNVERAMACPGAGKGTLHELAAGAEQGTADIVLGGTNHGDNRVLDENAAADPDDMSGGEHVTISIAPVDSLVAGPIDFLKIDTQGSEWHALQGCRKLIADSPRLGLLLEFWPWALRGTTPEALLDVLVDKGFSLGKATDAPYPMTKARIMKQMADRMGPKGGIDLYGVRGKPFHVLGMGARAKGTLRSMKEP
jgi:FkbM family methyltransferase